MAVGERRASAVSHRLGAAQLAVAADRCFERIMIADCVGERRTAKLIVKRRRQHGGFQLPAIRPREDLNGKIIGTARFGGSSPISALFAIEHLGLDLKRDKITLVQTGVDPDRMVVLENKAIDAGMLPPVATKVASGKGFHNLINMHESKLHYQNTGLTVKKITPR